MNNAINLILLAVLSSTAPALKDPDTRDEDISGTRVEVEHRLRSDGLYEYVYSLHAAAENLGRVTDFAVDLQCATDADPLPVPEPTGRSTYLGNRAEIGTISPTVMEPERGSVAAFGIAEGGAAIFGVSLPPGASTTGLRLISSMAPGLRQYSLKPAFPADPDEWAYDDMTDPNLPWVTDFTVHGSIAGPGCPGVTPPVEQPRFDGTLQRPESETINALLSYEAPLQDRMSVPTGTTTMDIRIRYAEEIDAGTFKVEPAHLRRLFNAMPGTTEIVTVPLHEKKTSIKLEVHPLEADPQPRKQQELDASRKDIDVFEIRTPRATPPGQAKQ